MTFTLTSSPVAPSTVAATVWAAMLGEQKTALATGVAPPCAVWKNQKRTGANGGMGVPAQPCTGSTPYCDAAVLLLTAWLAVRLPGSGAERPVQWRRGRGQRKRRGGRGA